MRGSMNVKKNIFKGVNTVVIFKFHVCKKRKLAFLALYMSSCHPGTRILVSRYIIIIIINFVR